MKKCILFCLSILILTSQLEAQWFGGCRRPWCSRYMDVTIADYDRALYGYVDDINYLEPYFLPKNYCFNYRRPSCYSRANQQYLMECIHFTHAKRQE